MAEFTTHLRGGTLVYIVCKQYGVGQCMERRRNAKLERWWETFEFKFFKISSSTKMEYMNWNFSEGVHRDITLNIELKS